MARADESGSPNWSSPAPDRSHGTNWAFRFRTTIRDRNGGEIENGRNWTRASDPQLARPGGGSEVGKRFQTQLFSGPFAGEFGCLT